MNSRVTMVDLVSIHSFLIKRMMAAAEEIFEAVKEKMLVCQQETERLRHENCCLRSTLTHCRDAQSRGAGGIQPDPAGSGLSAINVQMEVATVMSHEPLIHASTMTSSLSREIKVQEPTRCLTRQPEVLPKNEGNVGSDTQSSITDQSELCDNEAGDLNTLEVQHANISDGCIEFTVTEQDLQPHQICNKTLKKVPCTSLQTPQICKICGKSFSNKKCLRMHKVVHQNERPFGCDSCRWRFKLKSHLTEHKRLHTGDYRYRCPKCGKGFSRSNLVRLHLKSVHSL